MARAAGAPSNTTTAILVLDQVAGPLTGRAGFDVVIDTVGGLTRRASLDVLALGGRLVVMGNASNAADVTFGANELWFSGKGVGRSTGKLVLAVSPLPVASVTYAKGLRECAR